MGWLRWSAFARFGSHCSCSETHWLGLAWADLANVGGIGRQLGPQLLLHPVIFFEERCVRWRYRFALMWLAAISCLRHGTASLRLLARNTLHIGCAYCLGEFQALDILQHQIFSGESACTVRHSAL